MKDEIEDKINQYFLEKVVQNQSDEPSAAAVIQEGDEIIQVTD